MRHRDERVVVPPAGERELMARKKPVKKALLDASAPAGSITHWSLSYLEWLLVRNYAAARCATARCT